MTTVRFLSRLRVDTRGQDLIEYALIAGLIVLAAGAIMPQVAASIGSIHVKGRLARFARRRLLMLQER